MTYAVDSNVIIDVLIDDPEFATPAIDTLYRASLEGSLIACDVVWAEASSHITDKELFKSKMSEFGISFSPMTAEAALKAGSLWNDARKDQKRRERTSRQEVIPDFLIGAHALECADALITRDRGFLRKWFKTLKIIDPSRPSSK